MSRNVKVAETSKAAYRNLNPDSVHAIKELILETLKVLGLASSEQISEYTGKPHARIHKRMSELEREEKIWKPGIRVATKSGNTAYAWQLRGDNQPKTQEQENAFKKGTKSTTDYAKELITQPTLFQ